MKSYGQKFSTRKQPNQYKQIDQQEKNKATREGTIISKDNYLQKH